MWSKLSIVRCLLQRWWHAVTRPNGQSWEKLPEILKRAGQLICSSPAGQERDKIAAVYSWSSCIKYNYFKHSAPFSMWCAGAGSIQSLWLTGSLHLLLIKIRHCGFVILCYWILCGYQFPYCSVFFLVFFSILLFTCLLFRMRLLVALWWCWFYVHVALEFPYHMVILMLPFASIILFVAAWTS